MRIIILLAFILILLMSPGDTSAQKSTIGFGVGTTLFYGDLGGANTIGRPLFFDTERSETKPVGSVFYHRQLSNHWGLTFIGSYSSIGGDDKLIQPHSVYAVEWFRWYRNLNFHSTLWEVSVHGEYYFTRYRPGSLKYRWGPYLMLGFGMFHVNPKTEYNGTTIELHPLHTEGEGFPNSGNKNYSLYQPVVPHGFGILYNVSSEFAIGFEYSDATTFTDYMDDVSTHYVSQADFNSYFSGDPAKAALAYGVSRRSDELDPDELYGQVTAPGEQRGDPTDKDEYIFIEFTVHYVMGQHNVHPKNQMKCMKWGGQTGETKKRKVQR